MKLYDVVRFEGLNDDWLLYKYPKDEFFTKSKLVVSPGQVAILVHNGQIEKICTEGSFTLDTELLPFISRFSKHVHSGKNPYPLEIYFINKRLKLDVLWGTADPVDVIDPSYNIKIRIRARGQFGVRLVNYQYFYQTLVGTLMKDHYITFDVIRQYFRGFLNQKVRKALATEIVAHKITYFEISLHLDELQDSISKQLAGELDRFGFEVVTFSIETVDCPEEDLNKLNEILHKKAELDQLGDTAYRTVRGYDVLEAGAKGNGTASTFMGVGMGMQMGSQMGAAAGGIIPPQESGAKKDDSIACPKCGAPISATAKFCPECGTKIIHECPKCGAKVTPKQKFCPECGEKLYQ